MVNYVDHVSNGSRSKYHHAFMGGHTEASGAGLSYGFVCQTLKNIDFLTKNALSTPVGKQFMYAKLLKSLFFLQKGSNTNGYPKFLYAKN